MKFCVLIFLALATISGFAAVAVEKTVNSGDRVEIVLVSVDGTAPFSYQWKRNGADIAGATAVNYVIPAATSGSAGSYSIVVTNEAGSTRSEPAALIVRSSPGKGQLQFVEPAIPAVGGSAPTAKP